MADQLSTSLSQALPTNLLDKPKSVKDFEVKEAFNLAASDIESKVSISVSNFKDIKTGNVSINDLPGTDPASFKQDLTDITTKTSLNDFTEVNAQLSLEKAQAKLNFNTKIDSLESLSIKTDEEIKIRGDMFADLKQSVGSITNNQLRDFNKIAGCQASLVQNIKTDTINNAIAQAQKGIDNASQFNTQNNIVNKLNTLV